MNDRPYTRTGDILIAINPYQWLGDIYTTEKRKLYMPDKIYDEASGMVKKSIEPHVYEVSAMAFRGLAVNKKNQSILVSGESGAGKTESVKICLDHIATIQGGLKRQSELHDTKKEGQHQVMSSIVQRVVDSNPLLEAFGNAKTVRNDNSSRFGKFVQLQFDQSSSSASTSDDNINSDDCTLVGSHIEVYLLEKSRVVSHAPGERNFHIFYQILAASDQMKRKIDAAVLVGKSPSSFPYLGSRNNKMKVKRRRSSVGASTKNDAELIESMTDTQWFEQTVEELEVIGIKDETLLMLMRALCVVLQLGTISFVGDAEDNAMIPDMQTSKGGEFEKLANLMGIEIDVLRKAFTNKTIMAGSTEISTPLSPQQAKEGCDAYAKDLYSKTFSWLVGTINAATSASPVHSKTNGVIGSAGDASSKDEYGKIGVLDIFGFEAFEKNHFEQLCINYANERLQYMFASNVFVSLIDEYAREGLVVDFSYETNTDVLDLIAGKIGILATLNEECIRPGGSDEEFVYKALNQNKKSPRMFKTDLFTRYQFGVRHFAGPVVYTANDFMSTNKDIMPTDLIKVSRSSTNTIIAGEHSETGTSSGGGHRSRSNMTKNTVVSKFRSQLNSLMKTLSDTQTHYIRCIKPNGRKQPRAMENLEIMRQLSSGGVIAAVKIASASYPNKMEVHAILKRFRNIGDKPDSSQDLNIQVSVLLTKAFKDFVSPIKGGTLRAPFTIGKTRVYFRTGALEYLENARNENIGYFPTIIQKSYRMSPVRRNFLRQRKAAIKIQALIRGFVWKKRVERMPSCALTIQCWGRVVIAKKRLRKHKSALKIQRRWVTAREVIRFLRRTKAAVSIQKTARGSIQRPKFQKELVKKTSAVIRLQRITRGCIELAKFRVVLEQKRLKELQAAVLIQKIARGYNQRIKFKVMLEEQLARKTCAAIHFQRIIRGHIQLSKYRANQEQKRFKQLQAAVQIQSIARCYIQRIEFKAMLGGLLARKITAAIHFQRISRGHIRRVQFRALVKAEQERIAAEKAAEEARLKAERLATEKAAEKERLAAEKAAEEARIEVERLAEEKRRADEKRAEEERLAEDRRLAAEKKAEEERLAAERVAEERRIVAERKEEGKRLEAEKNAAERKAEEERLLAERIAAERRAEEERLEAEKIAVERKAEEERLEAERIIAERRAEKERLEAERIAAERSAEKERLEAEKATAAKAALEERLAATERQAEEKRVEATGIAAEKADLELRPATAEKQNEEGHLKLGKSAAENAALEARISATNDYTPEESSSSTGGFLSRLAGGLWRMAGTNPVSKTSSGVIVAAPWGSSDPSPLGQFLANSGGRSRATHRDDDTFAESVCTMMLPESLTAGQLRYRRENLREQQEMRKLRKKISEESRALRRLRTRGDKERASNKAKRKELAERLESANSKWENKLVKLPYDDRDTEFYTTALEEASVQLGLGSFEKQKERMNEEEKLQFDVQILQETQLVRQMQQMRVTGQQKFLHKKHGQREIDYLKSCQTWLVNHTAMYSAMQEMQRSVQEMKTLYEETLRRQEAAFARHDADMTIRESIEDIF
eukprot:scaffold2554_cov156-Amphora_coffeaeformis.AAC.5